MTPHAASNILSGFGRVCAHVSTWCVRNTWLMLAKTDTTRSNRLCVRAHNAAVAEAAVIGSSVGDHGNQHGGDNGLNQRTLCALRHWHTMGAAVGTRWPTLGRRVDQSVGQKHACRSTGSSRCRWHGHEAATRTTVCAAQSSGDRASTAVNYEGRCSCGAVVTRLQQEPFYQLLCHCTLAASLESL